MIIMVDDINDDDDDDDDNGDGQNDFNCSMIGCDDDVDDVGSD